MTPEKRISEVVAAQLAEELKGYEQQRTALEVQLSALRAAKHDLETQCAELHEKLAESKKDWRQYERAVEFLGWCENNLGPL